MTPLEQAAQAESIYLSAVKAAKEKYEEFLVNSSYEQIEHYDYDSKYSYWIHPNYIEAAKASMEHWDLSLDSMCEYLGIEELPSGAVLEDY